MCKLVLSRRGFLFPPHSPISSVQKLYNNVFSVHVAKRESNLFLCLHICEAIPIDACGTLFYFRYHLHPHFPCHSWSGWTLYRISAILVPRPLCFTFKVYTNMKTSYKKAYRCEPHLFWSRFKITSYLRARLFHYFKNNINNLFFFYNIKLRLRESTLHHNVKIQPIRYSRSIRFKKVLYWLYLHSSTL